MKCIPSCGYNLKPDNINTLTRHIEECMSEGACRKLPDTPKVIWKDGEFTVVSKVGKKDTVFEINLIEKKAIELTPRQIKTAAEVVAQSTGGVNATMGPLSSLEEKEGTKPKRVKKIKAELKDDFI